ncbi:hypothetical protein TNCV_4162191 [Trichonephila clavipes]|nr:hypothetical protein TNCV_4162191 [Trichonephila clavipes]
MYTAQQKKSLSTPGVNIFKVAETTLKVIHARIALPRQKWLAVSNKSVLVLHQDNEPAHSAWSVKKNFTKYSLLVLDAPFYLPDLATCDLNLFCFIR